MAPLLNLLNDAEVGKLRAIRDGSGFLCGLLSNLLNCINRNAHVVKIVIKTDEYILALTYARCEIN